MAEDERSGSGTPKDNGLQPTESSILRRTQSSPEDAVENIKRTRSKELERMEQEEVEAHRVEETQFAKAEQFGSRAVGGIRPDDERQFGKVESTDYLIPDTQQEEAYQRTFTPALRTRRRIFIWGLYFCLGVSVAAIIIFILQLCDAIQKVRSTATEKFLHKNDLLGAWLVWTGSSLALCMGACVMVLWQPAAASSGIPALIAFLNGVNPIGGKSPLTKKATGFLSRNTLIAKSVGMILSIPSGLCLGPEGPIIHIGALMAHHTTDFFQTLSHKLLPERFHFSVKTAEARDFLATGAAVGICVAFRAPLAGCLFVVEEASSFFTTEHLEYTFFATVVAYMVALLLANPDDGFTKFKQATGHFCSLYDWFDMVLFVIIAALGGFLGALFNKIVEHLNAWRAHKTNPKVWSRVTEVVLLVLFTGTVSVFLPLFFPCEHPTREMLMKDSVGCLSEEDAFQISDGRVSHSALKNLLATGSYSTELQQEVNELLEKYRAPEAKWSEEGAGWKDMVWIDNGHHSKDIYLHYQHAYTCEDGSYNGMSMLWLNGGVKGVKVLMQRGFPHLLSWEVLLVFCAVYFFLAAYTSGVSVPAGLIVPHLLIGGSYGRAFGLLGIIQKKAMCTALHDLEAAALTDTAHLSTLNFTYGVGDGEQFLGDADADPSSWMYQNTYFWSTVYRWVGRGCRLPDPGMYAVVGMAAFLSGSGRITMMLACVIIELTDDASVIGPVGVASIVAMIVGNLFNHGLYHGLIPVMNMPFLNAEPADVMNLVQVAGVMQRNVICLSKMADPNDVKELVHKCEKTHEITHHAFPVVDEEIPGSMDGKKLRGIISLQSLKLAMKDADAIKATGTNARRNRFLTGLENIKFTDFEHTESNIQHLCEWLIHIPLMHDLADDVLRRIAGGMRIGKVKPGQDIIHVGEPGNAMYFMEDGAADAIVRGVSVFSYTRGGHFGELALLTNEPRKATVRAGPEGAKVWRLDRVIFEETLKLSNRKVNLLKFADRSPITTVPHAKVARAFDMFRKLGMRHMCVIDDEHRLVGILTRKDLMTYRIRENIMSPRAEAMIQQFLYRWRKKRDARLEGEAKAGSSSTAASNGAAPAAGSAPNSKVSETTGLASTGSSWDTFKFEDDDDGSAVDKEPADGPGVRVSPSPASSLAQVSNAQEP